MLRAGDIGAKVLVRRPARRYGVRRCNIWSDPITGHRTEPAIVPDGRRAPHFCSESPRNRRRPGAGAVLITLSVLAAGLTACSDAGPPGSGPDPRPGSAAAPGAPAARAAPLVARTRPPSPATVVLASGGAGAMATDVARQLFVSAPVVVVADAYRPGALAAAASQAVRAHAPLLLLTPGPGSPSSAPSPGPPSAPPGHARTDAVTVGSAQRAEIDDLHPRVVLAVGMAAGTLSARLPGVHVVTGRDGLPATTAPPPLAHVAVLVPAGEPAATMAVTTTAQVAGAAVVPVHGDDPRADPAAIAALSAIRPDHVLGVGAGFGPAARLAARAAVAATGAQLPGGGQVVFPGRRLVALYGDPGAPALGALGQQDLAASIARARRMAALYRPLSSVPVVPAFEIIATVAQASPGPDGSYSSVSSVASLRPWVDAATAAGLYVVLDLQPGRADLLSQAEIYEPLLRRPNVGLALDPEWKLQPGQVPLHQIGSVGIGEVSRVVSWLAALTAAHHLPQKLLVLHQFRLSMLQGERGLDTREDGLAIVVHMDGQGTPGMKQETWNAVTGAAPPGVFFGWKDFFMKDHPMLSPQNTMSKHPQPVMISYQ